MLSPKQDQKGKRRKQPPPRFEMVEVEELTKDEIDEIAAMIARWIYCKNISKRTVMKMAA